MIPRETRVALALLVALLALNLLLNPARFAPAAWGTLIGLAAPLVCAAIASMPAMLGGLFVHDVEIAGIEMRRGDRIGRRARQQIDLADRNAWMILLFGALFIGLLASTLPGKPRIVWLLPLAAIGSSVRLRRAALAVTLFLVLSFVPATGILLAQLHINPTGSSVGQAANARWERLAQ